MLKKFTVKMSKGMSIALLGIVVSTFLFISSAAGQPDLAEAAVPSLDAVSEMTKPINQPDSNTVNAAGQTWTQCTPAAVAVFPERVHVRCAAAVGGGIIYFALSTKDTSHVARMLSVLTTAHALGRTINILYDPNDTSGTAINCLESDCRLILAAEFF